MGACVRFQHFKDSNAININNVEGAKPEEIIWRNRLHVCISSFVLMSFDMIVSVSCVFAYMPACSRRVGASRIQTAGLSKDHRCIRQSELASQSTVGAHYCILWAGKCLSVRIH